MKNLFKKIGALLVAAVMVLAMASTAFAETKNEATIKVNNAGDATLTYAQVIVPDQTTRTGWNFVGGANGEVAQAYKTAYRVTDAQAAIEAVIANKDASKLGAAQATAANKVVFRNMSKPQTVSTAGVYLIKATEKGYTYNIMAAYVGFGEVTKVVDGEKVKFDYPSLVDAEVDAKKTEIKVTKEVTDSDNVTHTGDILTYTVKTNVPFINPTDTDKTFVVKDILTGAEYTTEAPGEALKIKLGGTDVTSSYTINYNTDKNQFTVDLSGMIDDANSNAGIEVVITYSVKVTAANDEITNTAKVGNKLEDAYDSAEVKTYEGNITLTKTNDYKDKENKSDMVTLAGAEFEVRKANKESDALKFTRLADGVYKYDPEGKVTEVFTKADGTVKVQGLDVGTYYFKEITAPQGYSVNQNQSEAILEVGENEKATGAIAVTTGMTDTKLSALPSTGGMGTYLFTIIGVVVMAGAAGAFFISRRKGSEE